MSYHATHPESTSSFTEDSPALQALYPTTSGLYPNEKGFEKKPSGLTGIILTFNHGHCIERALASLEGTVDQILVVDQGSTDNTLAIVRKYTEHIIYTPSPDLEWVLGEILNHVYTPWALWCRADEWLPRETRQAITHHLKQHPNASAGCTLTNQPRWYNKPLNWGGFHTTALRLFRPEQVAVHCQPTLSTPYTHQSGQKPHPIKPVIPVEPYANMTALLDSIATEQSTQQTVFRRTYNTRLAPLAPIPTFLPSACTFMWHYIFRLGWLDGSAGFLWAWYHAHRKTVRRLFKNEQALYTAKQQQRRSSQSKR
jgi:(heptosyl)LPS beta-1,4-glucosyltransferase